MTGAGAGVGCGATGCTPIAPPTTRTPGSTMDAFGATDVGAGELVPTLFGATDDAPTEFGAIVGAELAEGPAPPASIAVLGRSFSGSSVAHSVPAGAICAA